MRPNSIPGGIKFLVYSCVYKFDKGLKRNTNLLNKKKDVWIQPSLIQSTVSIRQIEIK